MTKKTMLVPSFSSTLKMGTMFGWLSCAAVCASRMKRVRTSLLNATSGGGVIGFLPGMPPRSIADRQSFVATRIDYLNYLSSNDAYLVATADNAKIANLKVLVPRVLLLVRLKNERGADAAVKRSEERRGGKECR